MVTRKWEDANDLWTYLYHYAPENHYTLCVTLSKELVSCDEIPNMIQKEEAPFNVYLPKPPMINRHLMPIYQGWRLNNEKGLPDLEKSLEGHGKFSLFG